MPIKRLPSSPSAATVGLTESAPEPVEPLPAEPAPEAPKPAEPAGPPALDPSLLAAFAAAVDDLKASRAKEAALCTAMNAACDAHAGAKAHLDAQRAKVLAASTALAGGDIDDNFIPLSDEDARRLAADAMAARRGVAEHARAKLFGG